MDVQNILNSVGLSLGAAASGLIAANTYAEQPLIGQVLSTDSDENVVIDNRNKKRAICRRIGFCLLVVGFVLQL